MLHFFADSDEHALSDLLLEIDEKDKKLEINNLELNAKLIELSQHNRALSDIKNKIEKILVHTSGETKRELKSVINLVGSILKEKDNWSEFKSQFERLHPHFFTEIKNRFPKLTNEDLKYCAYLKMHMSNREIANVLHINQDSVRTHKYRLKKKMKLDKSTDLQVFILSL